MADYTPTAEQIKAMKWVDIRETRNDRLRQTDWWAVSDRTMTSAQTKYRQDLRDLPSTTDDPDKVVFPTMPE
tara:strand:- start:708 stop:923 length:216 start_codon:yes stop_codon:yes gene_type:complete